MSFMLLAYCEIRVFPRLYTANISSLPRHTLNKTNTLHKLKKKSYLETEITKIK